jgi:transcriptional regulator with XRE-family HTH domain
MNFFVLNITYELWKAGIPKEEWTSQTAKWIESDINRAKELLFVGKYNNEVPLSSLELSLLAKNLSKSEETLLFTNPLDEYQQNILLENLRYLIHTNAKKGSKSLAKVLNVTPETISRWLNDKRKPTKSQQVKLKEAFRVSQSIDLEQHPLFLDFTYLGVNEMRVKLKQLIDKSDNTAIVQLFPLVKKLFE